MNKLFVMNSAMMPQDGFYERITLTQEEFVRILKNANEVVSCIGYPSVCKVIEKISGISLPVNRSLTVLEDKSYVLVVKLPYRIKDPSQKGFIDNENPDQYEYILTKYRKDE